MDCCCLSDALNKFLSFVSRYEHCTDGVAREIERAKKDSEPTTLDNKTFDSVRAEYESFVPNMIGLCMGFVFSLPLCAANSRRLGKMVELEQQRS